MTTLVDFLAARDPSVLGQGLLALSGGSQMTRPPVAETCVGLRCRSAGASMTAVSVNAPIAAERGGRSQGEEKAFPSTIACLFGTCDWGVPSPAGTNA